MIFGRNLATRIIVFLVFLSFVVLLLSAKKHRTESVEDISGVKLSSSYIKVVSSMAKKESFERLTSASGGLLVSRKWDEFNFDLGGSFRISGWELKGRGEFVVASNSKDFNGEMRLIQRVELDRKGLRSLLKSAEPSGHIISHDTELEILNSKPPILNIKTKIVYERIIPFWMCDQVDKKVSDYNKNHIASIVKEVKLIVED